MDRDDTAGPRLPPADLTHLAPAPRRSAALSEPHEPDAHHDAGTAATAGATPAIGDVLGGKYRIDSVIARGGMSVIYRATHLELERQVAVKVLPTEASALPEYVARLKREALAASRIRSEHVVRVFDFGELSPGRTPYLVMEYLVGADLATVLARQGPLPAQLAVTCILQSCEALAEAHAMNVVHRDLKPANLFLTTTIDDRPCIKVLDFGISRMTRHVALSPLTDPGMVLGTPSYMAPEQMEASDLVDARTDIWALGAILYELLVGRPPYAGDALPQIFMQIARSRTPRPSEAQSGVGPELDAIVAKCLGICPKRRYPSVAELAWALAALGLLQSAYDSAERISHVLGRRPRDLPITLASARVARRATGAPARFARPKVPLVLFLASALAIALAGVVTYAKVAASPGTPKVADDESAIILVSPARRTPADSAVRKEQDLGSRMGNGNLRSR